MLALPKRKTSPKITYLALTAGLILCAGIYILLSATSPMFVNLPTPAETDSLITKISNTPAQQSNQLIIPRINLNVPIVEGADESALNKGAWHRHPDRGDPITGGNFILSGHRFYMGISPEQTTKLSPFYHIDALKEKDSLFVDWRGIRYRYQIVKIFSVPSTQIDIENPSQKPKLTLYSCTILGGENNQRYVIEADPVF